MKSLSLFNISKTLGESTWVYNTLTSAFIKIATSVWSGLQDAKDESLLDMLYQQGFVVDDNEVEFAKYRYIYYSKMFDHRTLSVTIAPTMCCNFGCSYCFEGMHKVMPTMAKDVEDYCSMYKDYLSEMLPVLYERMQQGKENIN